MKNVTELLRDADPVLHESTTSSKERDCRRQAILAAASRTHDRTGAQPRSRMVLLIALGFIAFVVSILVERMWSPLIANVYAAPVRFEVKLAEDEPAPGLQEVKVSERLVYLHAEAIVTNSDISRAYLIQVDHSAQYNVGVEFNSSGTEKIRAATAKHIGRPVAIMLDGQVIMAPKVRSAIGKSAVISGEVSKTEADRIVKGITVIR